MNLTETASEPATSQDAPIDWSTALAENDRWMRTVIRSRVRDQHAADEVMQEVAIAVLDQRCRPIDASKVAPWLYRVAVRHTINYRRRNGRRQRLIKNFARDKARSIVVDDSPRDWVFIEETQQGLQNAMDRLSASDRDLLLLKYTEGWTYRQLADHLGIKVKTVEHRLLKARQALRSELREEGIQGIEGD